MFTPIKSRPTDVPDIMMSPPMTQAGNNKKTLVINSSRIGSQADSRKAAKQLLESCCSPINHPLTCKTNGKQTKKSNNHIQGSPQSVLHGLPVKEMNVNEMIMNQMKEMVLKPMKKPMKVKKMIMNVMKVNASRATMIMNQMKGKPMKEMKVKPMMKEMKVKPMKQMKVKPMKEMKVKPMKPMKVKPMKVKKEKPMKVKPMQVKKANASRATIKASLWNTPSPTRPG